MDISILLKKLKEGKTVSIEENKIFITELFKELELLKETNVDLYIDILDSYSNFIEYYLLQKNIIHPSKN